MKKQFIKFFMRDKRLDITLPYDQAEKVIDSPQQLIKVTGNDGKWTGVTINKAEIIGTDHNFDDERDANYNKNQLPEPKKNPIDIDKFRPDFIKKPQQYKDA